MSQKLYTSYHFDDCTFPAPDRLPPEKYNRALQTFIRVCADIVLFDQAKKLMYLAKRTICFPKWWVIGGQIWPGESEVTGALRCLKRETSLQVKKHRLRFLLLNRYMHAGLAGEPARDNFTFVFALPVSKSEIAQAEKNLDSAEYDTTFGLRPFDKASLSSEHLPSPIISIFFQLFPDNN